MKVLRAIGGFFAKIGRWIAATAWIQPLLIVGGIFGIIFSIPYIKQGIEAAQKDNTDHYYEYYKNHSLDLKEGGKADKLLGYLEEEEFDSINKEFGEKFFLGFVKKDCANCKEAVAGFKNLDSKFKEYGLQGKFKLYTILVDKKDNDDEYMAKKLLRNHNDFFNSLSSDFSETDDYVLYKNVPSVASSMKSSINKLPEATNEDGEGIDTPFFMMYDFGSLNMAGKLNTSGVSALFFNYIELIEKVKEYSNLTTNDRTKGYILRDCWSYSTIFSEDYDNN